MGLSNGFEGWVFWLMSNMLQVLVCLCDKDKVERPHQLREAAATKPPQNRSAHYRELQCPLGSLKAATLAGAATSLEARLDKVVQDTCQIPPEGCR